MYFSQFWGMKHFLGPVCDIRPHWGRSLCSKKCAQMVFSCFWLQNRCELKFERSCQFFDTLRQAKFQLVTVKYYKVEALFCKMSRRFEKNCLCTHKEPIPGQVTVLGTCPVLEIGPILRHLRLVWTMEFFMFTIFEISWFLSARGSVLQVQAKIKIFS